MAMHGSRSDIFIWHRYYIPSYVDGGAARRAGLPGAVERLPVRARACAACCAARRCRSCDAGASATRSFDRSRYRIAEDFSRSLLETLPPGAHLMASDDNILFVLIYLSLVERRAARRRPDPAGRRRLRSCRRSASIPTATRSSSPTIPNWTLPALEIVPVGLVFRALRAGRAAARSR